MRLRRQRSVAWIAAFAVLLQALWPLLSHARPKTPALAMPICSIGGVMRDLEIKAGQAPLDERSARHGEHCKLCVFGNGKSVAIVSADVLAVPEFHFADQKFVRGPESFAGPARRPPAHPRAPPSQA